MTLFAILHNLVAPLTNLAQRRDAQRRRELLEHSLDRVPAHLRDDVAVDEKFWRYD